MIAAACWSPGLSGSLPVTRTRNSSRRQFFTNRTAHTQDNNNVQVGKKPVTQWHRREREKKRERERNLKWRKRREGAHGSAEARRAEGQAEM
jgi:hypothetical protein